MKLYLKDQLLEATSPAQCFWVEDRQNAEISERLYREVHLTENKLRSLMGLAIHNLGFGWGTFLKDKLLVKKYQSRSKKYKQEISAFENVDDTLLSVDASDLKKILGENASGFDPYLDRSFADKWETFCAWRNHVAHNKLITYRFYNEFLQLLGEIDNELEKARQEYHLHFEFKKRTSLLLFDEGEQEPLGRDERVAEIIGYLGEAAVP